MSNKTTINTDTGEVVAFRSMWSNPFGIQQLDLSRELEEVFEEVPAFMVDPDTGKFLNETSQPKLISKGFINVQERIQSFAKECDIYAILDRFAATGDTSLITVRECSYGDISEIPNNLNDVAQFLNTRFKALDNLNPELAKMIVDPNCTAEEIEAKAASIYEARIKEYEANLNKDKGGNE